ncbi:MAG: hypothetical protein SNJ75_18840 [Gemmataceae bacterium]
MRCSRCNQLLLVYPGEPSAIARTEYHRLPWVILGLAVAIACGAIYLGVRSRPEQPPVAPKVGLDEQSLARVQEHLARGRFHRAVQLLEAFGPQWLCDDQRRVWQQWHRQAALAADLTDLSLEEMVQVASLQRDPREWQAQWQRYRHRGLLLDGVLLRDACHQFLLKGFSPLWKDEPIRVALDELELLHLLPIDRPYRVIFGLRLASVEREASGWVVRPLPESGVLFTDAATLQALSPIDLGDDLPEVMQRQADWLAALGR